MNAQDTLTAKAALESMVDRATLADVVGWLAEIADAKADHLRSNWQDGLSAKCWERAAAKLHMAAERVEQECV